MLLTKLGFPKQSGFKGNDSKWLLSTTKKKLKTNKKN